MWPDGLRLPAAIVAVALALGATVRAQIPPELSPLLSAAADYIEGYERQSGAVVSLENYYQNVQRGSERTTRLLKSDVLVLSVGDSGWLGFRDVFEVNGRAVRDHDERLYKLFLKPPADALTQARNILAESARYNIGQVTRNINIPTMALTYLKREYQHRSRFNDKGVETIDGIRTRVVEFNERALPRVITTSDGAPAVGRFWIDPEQGRIVRTELTLSGLVYLVITVTYAPQARLDGLWLPVSMREMYKRAGELTEGRATYSEFRRFNIDVNTIIK
jgi:hypothetical protein